ncbi:MAG: thioredoxin family protein [Phaeodactylibacter sp.]|uniref:thioredoxin family protein n=1 Tax=Phaeodactylibacter sp. TaxID=1940289 RepID=UPI0032EB8532
MKTIKILGTGCPKCKQTEAAVRKAVADLGITADIQKVEDIQDIMLYNVLSTPAVVIDEVVQIKGHVPKAAELEALLKA